MPEWWSFELPRSPKNPKNTPTRKLGLDQTLKPRKERERERGKAHPLKDRAPSSTATAQRWRRWSERPRERKKKKKKKRERGELKVRRSSSSLNLQGNLYPRHKFQHEYKPMLILYLTGLVEDHLTPQRERHPTRGCRPTTKRGTSPLEWGQHPTRGCRGITK